MPTTVAVYQITDLAHGDSKNEVFIDTKKGTELHITVQESATIISFPFGNRFDIIDGRIFIHDKPL